MKRRVRWNEANLREIEADKQVRKKIDEPKTPYPPLIEEDDNSGGSTGYAAHAEALKNALNRLALSYQNRKENSPFTAQGLAIDRDIAVSFEERRSAHYDEFKKVKEMQEKAWFLDDEHDNETHNYGSSSTFCIEIEGEIEIEDGDEILQTIDIEDDDDI